MRDFVLLAVGWLLAFLGQRAFSVWHSSFDGVLLYGLASLALAGVKTGVRAASSEGSEAPAAAGEKLPSWGWPAIATGAALTFAASLVLASRRWSNLGLALWLAGLASFVAPFVRTGFRSPRRFRILETLLLAGVLGLALFMRFHWLGQMPPALYLDEADNGVWALRFWDRPFSPFTENRDSSATLPYYLLGLALKAGGVAPLTMRAFQALVGTFTIAVFYALARRVFGFWPALMGAFLLAVSRWHVHFSRVVFVEILPVPVVEALVCIFLWDALASRSRSIRRWAWAGLAFGFGFHTYIGYRVFPVVVAAWLLYEFLVQRNRQVNLRNLVVFVLAALIAVMPLAAFAIRYPRFFVRRTQAASVLNDIRREHSYRPLWENIRKSALMYNYRGDPRPRHNLPHEPELDFWTAMMFGLGVGYAIRRLHRRESFVPLLWVTVGLLPSVLSLADSNPHSSRTLGNVMPVFLLVTSCGGLSLEVIRRTWGRKGVYALGAGACALLLAAGTSNYKTYFHRQANDRSVYYDFEPAFTAAGLFLQEHPECRAFISPGLANHGAVKLLGMHRDYEPLRLGIHIPYQGEPAPICYLLEPLHAPYLEFLRMLYPGGEVEERRDRYGQVMFHVFRASPEQIKASRGVEARYYASSGPGKRFLFKLREPDIFLEWDEPPSEVPFTVVWEGSLQAPEWGEYSFALETNGRAKLYLDDRLLLDAKGSAVRTGVTLPAGFHPLRVVYVSPAKGTSGGRIALKWKAPHREWEVVPPAALYPVELSRMGLLGTYYKGVETYEGEAALKRIDLIPLPEDLVGPFYSVRWEGYLRAPTSGQYIFGTISDDGSRIYVDDVLVVDNSGIHGARYAEGKVELSEGLHRIRVLYTQSGGARALELWWQPPGAAKSHIPPENLCYYCPQAP